jgi:hypothetical protein
MPSMIVALIKHGYSGADARGIRDRSHGIVTFLLACVLLLTPIAEAQSRPEPGTLNGTVRDPSGLVAPDVTVIVESLGTRARSQTTSDKNGYFILVLPPGVYYVYVDRAPFRRFVDIVDVESRTNSRLWVELKFRVVEERVDVRKRPTRLSSIDGPTTTTFAWQELDAQPLSARELGTLLSRVPNVVVTEAFAQAVFSAAGQRRHANTLTIDSISADLSVNPIGPGTGHTGSGALPAISVFGSTATTVPLASIDEIGISTTNASPERARSPGATTSIVTRAGSNRYGANLFLNLRPDSLLASDWFANASSVPQRRTQFWNAGSTFSGPVVRQRVFFFATWETQQIDRPVVTTIAVPSYLARQYAPESIRRLFDAYPQPNGLSLPGGLSEFSHEFPVTSDLSVLSVRIDGNLGSRTQVFSRINLGGSDGDELSADALRLPAMTFSQVAATSTTSVTAGLTSMFSPVLLYDLRANHSRHRGSLSAGGVPYAQPLPLDLLVPSGAEANASVMVNLFPGPGGIIRAGRLGESAQEQIQFVNTLTYASRRHDVRVGVDFRRVTSSTNPASTLYLYRFFSLADLLLDSRVRQVMIQHLEPARWSRTIAAIFGQDAWRVSSRLMLQYGVRYTIQPPPASQTDLEPLLMRFEALPALQPRRQGARLWDQNKSDAAIHLSAAYRLHDQSSRDTTLRTGLSLLLDDLTNVGSGAYGGSYPYVRGRVIQASVFPVPPHELTAMPPASFDATQFAPSYAVPEHLRIPRTFEWQVGVDQALGAHRLSLAYVGAAGRALVYWQAYGPTDTQNHIVHIFSNDATSDYHALLFQYMRPAQRGFQGSFTYTWSHAIDTDSGEMRAPQPPASLVPPVNNRGSSDFDRRHVAHGQVSYRAPETCGPKLLRPICANLQFDLVGMLRSGAPVSVAITRDLGYGIYRVRPDVVPGVPPWIADPAAPTKRRLNPDAFVIPADGSANGLGRNTFRGSPLRQIDLAISRSFKVGSRITLQARVDAFNVFNLPNFGPPESDLGAPSFGRALRSYADALGTGTLTTGGLIPLQQAGGPRSIQLGFRLAL